MKRIAAVGAARGAGADDFLDLIDGVAVAAAVGADTGRFGLSCCRLTALTPDHCPIQHGIDAGELADAVELGAGNGERFVGAPEQLGSDRLVVDDEIKLAVQLLAAGQAPDPTAGAAWSNFAVGV